jgi:hypothetical protein
MVVVQGLEAGALGAGATTALNMGAASATAAANAAAATAAAQTAAATTAASSAASSAAAANTAAQGFLWTGLGANTSTIATDHAAALAYTQQADAATKAALASTHTAAASANLAGVLHSAAATLEGAALPVAGAAIVGSMLWNPVSTAFKEKQGDFDYNTYNGMLIGHPEPHIPKEYVEQKLTWDQKVEKGVEETMDNLLGHYAQPYGDYQQSANKSFTQDYWKDLSSNREEREKHIDDLVEKMNKLPKDIVFLTFDLTAPESTSSNVFASLSITGGTWKGDCFIVPNYVGPHHILLKLKHMFNIPEIILKSNLDKPKTTEVPPKTTTKVPPKTTTEVPPKTTTEVPPKPEEKKSEFNFFGLFEGNKKKDADTKNIDTNVKPEQEHNIDISKDISNITTQKDESKEKTEKTEEEKEKEKKYVRQFHDILKKLQRITFYNSPYFDLWMEGKMELGKLVKDFSNIIDYEKQNTAEIPFPSYGINHRHGQDKSYTSVLFIGKNNRSAFDLPNYKKWCWLKNSDGFIYDGEDFPADCKLLLNGEKEPILTSGNNVGVVSGPVKQFINLQYYEMEWSGFQISGKQVEQGQKEITDLKKAQLGYKTSDNISVTYGGKRKTKRNKKRKTYKRKTHKKH